MYISSMIVSLVLSAGADTSPHRNGDLRERGARLEVWSTQRQAWVAPEQFFDAEIEALDGPTYGRTHDYPPYDTVSEWETLIDVLPDGRQCPMVFFHQRWRRLPDVLALDAKLREYGGCADVLDY